MFCALLMLVYAPTLIAISNWVTPQKTGCLYFPRTRTAGHSRARSPQLTSWGLGLIVRDAPFPPNTHSPHFLYLHMGRERQLSGSCFSWSDELLTQQILQLSVYHVAVTDGICGGTLYLPLTVGNSVKRSVWKKTWKMLPWTSVPGYFNGPSQLYIVLDERTEVRSGS